MPAKKSKVVAVKIQPMEKEEKGRIYSNYIIVRHTPFDFTLEFCEILPVKGIEAVDGGTAIADIKVKLALPIKLIPSLISALTDNYKKYEEAYEKEKK